MHANGITVIRELTEAVNSLAAEIRNMRGSMSPPVSPRRSEHVPRGGVRVRKPEHHRPSRSTGQAVGDDLLMKLFLTHRGNGNSVAKSIADIVEEHGYRLRPTRSYSGLNIPAIGAVTTLFYDSPELLRSTLTCSRLLGDIPMARSSGALLGIAAFLKTLPEESRLDIAATAIDLARDSIFDTMLSTSDQRKVTVADHLNDYAAQVSPSHRVSDITLRREAFSLTPHIGAERIRSGLPDPITHGAR